MRKSTGWQEQTQENTGQTGSSTHEPSNKGSLKNFHDYSEFQLVALAPESAVHRYWLAENCTHWLQAARRLENLTFQCRSNRCSSSLTLDYAQRRQPSSVFKGATEEGALMRITKVFGEDGTLTAGRVESVLFGQRVTHSQKLSCDDRKKCLSTNRGGRSSGTSRKSPASSGFLL